MIKCVSVRLKEIYKEASSTEKNIIKYVLANIELMNNTNIYELAQHTYSSPSSVIRLCKKIHFKGYKDFHKAVVYENAVREQNRKQHKEEISNIDNIETVVDKITYLNTSSIEDTKNLLDYKILEKCVEIICNSRNICLFGIGSSFIVAKDAQQKFLRVNKPCSVYEDWHLQLLQAKNMSKEDLGIIISYSGETDEMIKCANVVKEVEASSISITKYGNSKISDICDYNLYVAANESTFRSGALSSRISQLYIIDLLYTAFANSSYEYSLERISKTHIRKGEDDRGIYEYDYGK